MLNLIKKLLKLDLKLIKKINLLLMMVKEKINILKLMMENNIIITIYGCYNKYLDAIGVDYVERNWYLKKMCFGYFELR